MPLLPFELVLPFNLDVSSDSESVSEKNDVAEEVCGHWTVIEELFERSTLILLVCLAFSDLVSLGYIGCFYRKDTACFVSRRSICTCFAEISS
jgi:hypothetical protein